MGAAENIPHFLPEIWGLFIFGCIIFTLRFIVRLRTVGITNLSGDDYFAMCAWVFFTVDAVVVDRAYHYGTNVDFKVAELEAMTPARLHKISKGSKYELAAWFSYSALIWSMKATMLFFYRRLTFGLWQRRLVRHLTLACALTYLCVLLTITLGCRPFSHNWRVLPAPGLACTFRPQNVGVVAASNVATDLALLSVPLPLLWRLQVPVRQKAVVAAWLLTGVFVIAAAVVRVVVTLGSDPSTTTVNLWGVRETIVALVCVNAPMLRPLFLGRFWSGERWVGKGEGEGDGSSGGGGGTMTTTATTTTYGERSRLGKVRAGVGGAGASGGGGGAFGRMMGDGRSVGASMNDAGSEEYIMKNLPKEHGGVVVEVEVEIKSERRKKGERTDVEMGNSWGLGGS
ncbi:mg2+ transporter zinc transport protein [Diplodia corticola]|uniref:Mg2+ transporter zinc transport protein n=1 Tax=Diplodia corticola TaxID=236234 RepID=A0A1J9QTQ6_9PEZI|nr:mg2+ transporter zinc transport protein [Diplodia corticola]OJD31370.1 mg2+ transporter zinc transport protein [Diplodia corticola]